MEEPGEQCIVVFSLSITEPASEFVCVWRGWDVATPPPPLLVDFRNSLCKDDIALFSRFLQGLKQCSGSMTFCCGSGSGSADPCLWLISPDPDADTDPAIFVCDLQDANKKIILKTFSAYYFLNVHLHNLSKITSPKETVGIKVFLLFCSMIEGL
jgi:hypothetical protein